MKQCTMLDCHYVDSDIMCKNCTQEGGMHNLYEPDSSDDDSLDSIDESLCLVKLNCS